MRVHRGKDLGSVSSLTDHSVGVRGTGIKPYSASGSGQMWGGRTLTSTSR